MKLDQVSTELLRETLSYDRDTGVLTWRISPCGRVKAGDASGTPDQDGYLRTTLFGKKRRNARLAWQHATGEVPSGVIDHINGDKTDNRIGNLRDVGHSVNSQNRRSASGRSQTGILGVVKSGRKFKAVMTLNGASQHLGTYATPQEAYEAYVATKRAVHPGCSL